MAERIVSAAELDPQRPFVFDFPPQTESYQHLFTLGVEPSGDVATHGYAMWRLWAPKHGDAQLRRGNQPVRGQLALQTFYGESASKLLTGRSGPRVWAVTPRPVTALVLDVVSFAIAAGREGYRLSRQARATVQNRGVNGLLDEAIAYLQWRMSNGEGGDT